MSSAPLAAIAIHDAHILVYTELWMTDYSFNVSCYIAATGELPRSPVQRALRQSAAYTEMQRDFQYQVVRSDQAKGPSNTPRKTGMGWAQE